MSHLDQGNSHNLRTIRQSITKHYSHSCIYSNSYNCAFCYASGISCSGSIGIKNEKENIITVAKLTITITKQAIFQVILCKYMLLLCSLLKVHLLNGCLHSSHQEENLNPKPRFQCVPANDLEPPVCRIIMKIS